MGTACNVSSVLCCGLRPRPAVGGTNKTNYVLIDYESVQPEIVAALKDEHFKVLMFIGPNQARIDINVATALRALGTRAEYIRVSAAGRNALDFHIGETRGSRAGCGVRESCVLPAPGTPHPRTACARSCVN